MRKNFLVAIFLLGTVSLFSNEEDDFFASAEPTPSAPPTIEKAPDYVEPEPLIIPISIPVIGIVNLQMVGDDLEATFADKNKKISVGPLTIDQGKAVMASDNKLKITGRATLFGKQATFGLKEYNPDTESFLLGLTYTDKPTLELIPGMPFIIDATDVKLQKKQPVNIFAYTTIGTKKITLTMTVKDKQTDLAAETDSLGVTELLPLLKNTPLEGIQLSAVTFEMLDMFNKSAEKGCSVSAKTGLPKSLIPGVALQNVTFKLVVKRDVAEVVLDAASCTIEKMGAVTNAALKTSLEKTKKPTIIFSGLVAVPLADLGSVDVLLSTDINEGAVGSFSGTIVKPLVIAGLTVKQGTFTYNTQDASTLVTGIAEVYGYKGQFSYSKFKDATEKIQVTITEKEIKPFSLVPGFEHIAIASPVVTVEHKDGSYVFVMKGLFNGAAMSVVRTKDSVIGTLARSTLSELLPLAQAAQVLDIALAKRSSRNSRNQLVPLRG